MIGSALETFSESGAAVEALGARVLAAVAGGRALGVSSGCMLGEHRLTQANQLDASALVNQCSALEQRPRGRWGCVGQLGDKPLPPRAEIEELVDLTASRMREFELGVREERLVGGQLRNGEIRYLRAHATLASPAASCTHASRNSPSISLTSSTLPGLASMRARLRCIRQKA